MQSQKFNLEIWEEKIEWAYSNKHGSALHSVSWFSGKNCRIITCMQNWTVACLKHYYSYIDWWALIRRGGIKWMNNFKARRALVLQRHTKFPVWMLVSRPLRNSESLSRWISSSCRLKGQRGCVKRDGGVSFHRHYDSTLRHFWAGNLRICQKLSFIHLKRMCLTTLTFKSLATNRLEL